MSKRNAGLYGEFIIEKLRNDDRWALRALEIVTNNQTAGEFSVDRTTEQNGIGFNGTDAKTLTGIFKFYMNRVSFASHRNDTRPVTVTEAQMGVLHKRMPKYWKQILNASDSEKLHKLVAKAEVAEMMKIPNEKLPLHVMKKWTFDETREAFLKRLKNEQLVLNLTV